MSEEGGRGEGVKKWGGAIEHRREKGRGKGER